MLNLSISINVAVEDRDEAIELLKELYEFYVERPDVKISSIATDTLEAE